MSSCPPVLNRSCLKFEMRETCLVMVLLAALQWSALAVDSMLVLVPSMGGNEQAMSKSRLLLPLVLDNRRRYCSLANIQLVEENLKAGSEASAKKFKTEVIAMALSWANEGDKCLWLDNDVLIIDPKWDVWDAFDS